MTTDTTLLPDLEHPDEDPRLWLEEIEGSRALEWVAAENTRTVAELGGSEWEHDRDALRKALDRPDRLPSVKRRAGLLYNFWTDAEHKRGLWRRTTLEWYRKESPEWDILFDVDEFAASEEEDWVWHGATTLPPTHDRALLQLSRGGSDAVTLREFDLTTRQFVPDGFVLTQSKSNCDWLDRDTVLLSSSYGGDDFQTTSGYGRKVRLWHRGESPDTAPVLFEVPKDHLGAFSGVDRTAPNGIERILFLDMKEFFASTLWLGDRTGAKSVIDVPEDARTTFQFDVLLVHPRTAWTIDEKTYPGDSVLVFSLSEFLAGNRKPKVLFEPTARSSVSSADLVKGSVVLSILDELRPITRIFTPSTEKASTDASWTETTIPGLPEAGKVDVYALDAEEDESDGSLLVQIEDPITPPTLLLSSIDGARPDVLRRSSSTFDASGLAVTRFEAIAGDGERIPYFVTGPKEGPTGDAPVYLTAYGGFGLSILPSYNTSTGLLWLSRGGTSVLANIRGGGEFGTPWHDAGRKANKRVSHDDFAAVAADLVKRGITRPERIAAEGGSNGGLLIANIWTRYPERFGALFCTIPLADMRRYSKLLAGASWIAEYGDPEKEEDWEYLQHISAYHTASPRTGRSPPILVATTRRDDRVHPGHARKFASKLHDIGADVRFYEPEAGGHGYGTDSEQRAAFTALGHLFLRRSIGWNA